MAMTRVNRSTDCGNSPKNKMVEDIAIAMEMRDAKFLAGILDPEATWTNPDSRGISAEAMLQLLMKKDKPRVLTIDHIMSHGKVGAANGSTGAKGEQRFCHVIEFTSTKCNKIRRIESY